MMKSIEFTYWLQGAFELSEMTVINSEQTQTIKNHLAMVEYHEKNQMNGFCTWLKGFFEMCEPVELDEKQTKKIKDKLNSLFEHVIEPAINVAPPFPSSRMQLNPNEMSEMIKC